MSEPTEKVIAEFFHLITDADSAEVRRFLVANNLTERVNFRNIAYEKNVGMLQTLTGAQEVPCLVVIGRHKVVVGKDAIMSWLKANS